MIYFISDGVGHVKIGKTSDIESRLKQLQCGNAQELTVKKEIYTPRHEKDDELEKRFHSYFRRYNCKTSNQTSEWFEFSEEIQGFVSLSKEDTEKFIKENILDCEVFDMEIDTNSKGYYMNELQRARKRIARLESRINNLENGKEIKKLKKRVEELQIALNSKNVFSIDGYKQQRQQRRI